MKVLEDSYEAVRIPCTIQKQNFETQNIWLGKKKSGLLTRNKSKREESEVKAWEDLETTKQMWDGPFIAPSAGVITTQYGQQVRASSSNFSRRTDPDRLSLLLLLLLLKNDTHT